MILLNSLPSNSPLAEYLIGKMHEKPKFESGQEALQYVQGIWG